MDTFACQHYQFEQFCGSDAGILKLFFFCSFQRYIFLYTIHACSFFFSFFTFKIYESSRFCKQKKHNGPFENFVIQFGHWSRFLTRKCTSHRFNSDISLMQQKVEIKITETQRAINIHLSQMGSIIYFFATAYLRSVINDDHDEK